LFMNAKGKTTSEGTSTAIKLLPELKTFRSGVQVPV